MFVRCPRCCACLFWFLLLFEHSQQAAFCHDIFAIKCYQSQAPLFEAFWRYASLPLPQQWCPFAVKGRVQWWRWSRQRFRGSCRSERKYGGPHCGQRASGQALVTVSRVLSRMRTPVPVSLPAKREVLAPLPSARDRPDPHPTSKVQILFAQKTRCPNTCPVPRSCICLT